MFKPLEIVAMVLGFWVLMWLLAFNRQATPVRTESPVTVQSASPVQGRNAGCSCTPGTTYAACDEEDQGSVSSVKYRTVRSADGATRVITIRRKSPRPCPHGLGTESDCTSCDMYFERKLARTPQIGFNVGFESSYLSRGGGGIPVTPPTTHSDRGRGFGSYSVPVITPSGTIMGGGRGRN